MRMRLGRDLNAPFPKDGHEYGDYEKYEKNNVEVKTDRGENDFGDQTFFRNYQNMLRNMNTPEGDHIRSQDE